MSQKFYKSAEEFKKCFSSIKGEWKEESGKLTFRSSKGGIANFWMSNHSIQFQGKEEGRKELESAIFNCDEVQETHTTDNNNTKIFIVHGHDIDAKDQLELLLMKLGLEPYAIMNQSNEGKTLIEALEDNIGKDFSSSYGIVLLTPDDKGYSIKDGEGNAEPRARQNVILETGMLLASLTRKRMVLLVKGYLEIPSDLDGIIRIHYNDNVKEVAPKISDALAKAGFNISAEQMRKASM